MKAMDVNNLGQVVGGQEFVSKPRYYSRAWIWENGEIRALGSAPGWYGENQVTLAASVSDTGYVAVQVEGMHLSDGTPFTGAILWKQGQFVDLFSPWNNFERIMAVNDRGEAAGYIHENRTAFGGGYFVPVMWGADHTGAKFEGVLGGEAVDVNNQGVFFGKLEVGGQRYVRRPFFWKNGRLWHPDWNASGTQGYGAVNDMGEAVSATGRKASLYTGGRTVDLHPKSVWGSTYFHSYAEDINNHGDVVGNCNPYYGTDADNIERYAVLWKDGVMYRLDDIVVNNENWHFRRAEAINDNGWICGQGIHGTLYRSPRPSGANPDWKAYVLIPTDPPAPAAIAVTPAAVNASGDIDPGESVAAVLDLANNGQQIFEWKMTDDVAEPDNRGATLREVPLDVQDTNILVRTEGMVWDGTHLWVVGPDFTRYVAPDYELKRYLCKLDVSDGSIIRRFDVDHIVCDRAGLAWDGRHLITRGTQSDFVFLDPSDCSVVKRVNHGGRKFLAWTYGGGAFWLLEGDGTNNYNSYYPKVIVKLDAATAQPIDSYPVPPAALHAMGATDGLDHTVGSLKAIAWANGYLFVVNGCPTVGASLPPHISKLDPATGHVLSSFPLTGAAAGIKSYGHLAHDGNGNLWYANNFCNDPLYLVGADAFSSDWLDVHPAGEEDMLYRRTVGSGYTTKGNTANLVVALDPRAAGPGTHTATITITSNDPDNPAVEVPVTFVVTGNNPPVAADDSASTAEDTSVTIDVLANDTDADGHTLSIASVTQGTNGSVTEDGTSVTYTPNTGWNGTDTFTYTVSDGNGGTDTATVTVQVSAALKAHWKLDEPSGTTAADSSGNGYNGTLRNSPVWTAGKLGGALSFDGTDDYVAIQNMHYSQAGAVEKVTVTFWMKAPQNERATLVDFDRSEYWSAGINFHQADGHAGRLSWDTTDSSGVLHDMVSTVRVDDGAWHHIAVVFDSAAANDKKIYIDGVLNSQQDGHATHVRLGSGATRYGFLGDGSEAESFDGSRNSVYYKGLLDNVRIHNQVLSAAEIAAMADVNTAPVAADDSATTDEDTAVTVNVLANDTDVDGDTLSIASVTQGTNGSVTEDGTSVTYTPDTGFSGIDTFTYTASDGNGGSDTATVTVTVTDVNEPPVAADQSMTTDEDTAVGVTLTATDPDGDDLTYSVVSGPSSGTLSGTAPALTYTPNVDWSGTDSFTFKANDGTLDSNIATVSIGVDAVNDAPVAADDSASIQEDTAVTVDVLANDTDAEGDTLSIASVTQGANGLVANNGTDVTYTPDTGFSGTDTFTYTASDGNGGTDTATVTITVDAPYDIIIGEAGSVTTDQSDFSQWHTINLSRAYANPVVVMGPMSYADTNPSTLRVKNTSTSSFQFQIDEWDYLDGYHITETAGYVVVEAGNHTLENGTQIRAGTVSAGTSWVSVTFDSAFTSIPVVTAQCMSVNESSAITPRIQNITTTGFDIMIEEEEALAGTGHAAETLGWIAMTAGSGQSGGKRFDALKTPDQVTHTSCTMNFSQAFSDVPVCIAAIQTYDGGDTAGLRYKTLNSSSITLFIEEEQSADDEVNHTTEIVGALAFESGVIYAAGDGENIAPVATDDTAETGEDTAVTIDVLANDTDADGDTLSIASVTQGTNGSVTEDGTSVIYTPNTGWSGSDSFTYTVTDGNGGTDTAAVTVTVNPSGSTIGAIVVIDPDYANVNYDFFQFRITNTSDSESVTSVSLEIEGGGVFDLFEAAGAYTVSPDMGSNNDGVSSPSVTLDFSGTGLAAGASEANSAGATASDIDGTLSSIAVTVTFSNGSELSGSMVNEGDSDDPDPDMWIVTLTGGSANHPPVAESQSVSTDEDTPVEITLSAADSDNDPLTYSVVSGPSNGTLSGTAPALTYTPNADWSGTDSFTFKANDGTVDSNIVTVTIEVGAVNDAPVLDPIGEKSVSEGQTLTFSISATDAEGDTLAFSAASLPTGAVFDTDTQTFTWTPGFDTAGNYPVLFSVTDNGTPPQSDSEEVTITVGNVNRPPVLDPIGSRSVAENQELVVVVDGSDPDGDAVTFSTGTLPSGAVFDADSHTLTWTPEYTQSGNYAVRFSVSDGTLSDSEDVTITVGNINRPPTAVISFDTLEGTAPLTVNLSGASSTDPDNDTLTYAWDLGDDVQADSEDVSHIYTQSGTYTVVLTVSDGALTAQDTVVIQVDEDEDELLSIVLQKPGTYRISQLFVGSYYYVDRSCRITSMPDGLMGAWGIRTANNDKYATTSDHLVLDVNKQVDVYVAYDKRAFAQSPNLPQWMTSYTDTGLTISAQDGGASPLRLFKKEYAAGTITLGGNYAGATTGAHSNYVVLITEAGELAKPAQVAKALSKVRMKNNAADSSWSNPGDADGDGLQDDFEVAHGLKANSIDSNNDSEPDETQRDADGRTLFEVANDLHISPVDGGDGAGSTGTGTSGSTGTSAAGSSGGGGGGGCFISTLH